MNNPKKPMKKILMSLSLLILTFVFATNTLAASGKMEQDAGPYHVIMQTNPENLMANQTGTMTMIIKDKMTGQPITGAKVMMGKSTMMSSSGSTGNKSNMAGMDMSSSTDQQGGMVMKEQASMGGMAMVPGSYMVEGMMFNQPGQWNQTVTINSSLGVSTVDFPMMIGKSGPNLVLIGSVAGVVVIAGLLAALLKRKKK